jgi:hypothetical protein
MEENNQQSIVSFSSENEEWIIFGYHIPKNEVVFFSQTVVLYIVIITCLINLSIKNGDKELWCSFLSAAIGYLLPNPSMKRDKVLLQRSNL